MSNGPDPDSVEQSAKRPDEQSTFSDQFRALSARVFPKVLPVAMWIAFFVIMTGSVTAQSDVGDVYCGTGVETGITIVFGAIAGLGLPATGFYVCRAGLSYMRAGGNPEKKNTAKERLVMSGIGFGIIVLALISPELIGNVGSQMGFEFSSCVQPF
ncbi:pilin [Natrinema versiforme]